MSPKNAPLACSHTDGISIQVQPNTEPRGPPASRVSAKDWVSIPALRDVHRGPSVL